jgi:hypothetical protein
MHLSEFTDTRDGYRNGNSVGQAHRSDESIADGDARSGWLAVVPQPGGRTVVRVPALEGNVHVFLHSKPAGNRTVRGILRVVLWVEDPNHVRRLPVDVRLRGWSFEGRRGRAFMVADGHNFVGKVRRKDVGGDL